jgi:hypothetical protein
MLPLNRLRRDDPNKTNIITTAATPKINANFAGEIDSKLNTLILLEKYITIFQFYVGSKKLYNFNSFFLKFF